jgi:hypothetical protein
MSKKKKALLIIASLLAVTVSLAVISVMAVHDLYLFELDRDALDNGGIVGDDWDTLDSGGGSAAEFTGIIPDVIAVNPLGSTGTQFQAGGSKDDLDISPGGATGQHWKWDPGEPLDKDDITNAYAAAYLNTLDTGVNYVGDLIIYFGLDRFANNGSAQVGFWFLQDPEFGLTTVASGGGYLFSGHHVIGDILVQSNFSGGGVIDTISVYKWVGSGGPTGTLDLLFNAQDCLTGGLADDPACATVSQVDTSAPWSFTPKFGSPGIFPQGSFFEGGINITNLVPDAGCFTGFLAETRSSTPFDSRLKDFALGEFDLCSIEVEKTGDDLSKVGDDVDYTITITNTGSITLYKDDIKDSLLGDFAIDREDSGNGYETLNNCGESLAPGASCTIMATRTVEDGDDDPLPNTVEVTYRGKSDLSGTAVYDSDDHEVNLFQPSVMVAKTGDVLSKVSDPVTYNYLITNTSSDDSPDLILDSVLDSGDNYGGAGLGDLTATASANGCDTLASGDTCSFYVDYIVQEGDDDPLNNTVVVHFHPEDFPNDISANDDHEVDLFQPSIEVTKTGDTLSKVDDDVSYSVLIENTSSSGSPALWFDLISDSLQGELTLEANYDSSNCGASLAAGDSCQIDYTYTVQAGDADPLMNTVTVESHPFSFPNDIDDSDTWEVKLFQPSISVTKTGDELSKVGDDMSYTVMINNSSSTDSPALVFDLISDSLKGDLTNSANYTSSTCGVSLAAGASCAIQYTYIVQSGDPDPLLNTVTVETHPDGFPNDIDDSDSWEVELFQPSISVTKTGDELSKVGDDVSYTVTINNSSSTDSPALVFDLISDSLKGDLTNSANYTSSTCGASLAAKTSCQIHYTYTVQSGDPDPLPNMVTVESHPDGFTNDIDGSDGHSVNLFQPDYTLVCSTPEDIYTVGDLITFTYTFTSTGSTDTPPFVLKSSNFTVGGVTLSITLPGSWSETDTATYNHTVVSVDPSPLVAALWITYGFSGFPNELLRDASCSVEIEVVEEACTPGFWQGGNGSKLWNRPGDQQWDGILAQPFNHDTLFNDFFSTITDPRLDGQTMLQIVSNDGGIANSAEKAARNMVAAYLNESAFPGTFPATSLADLETKWYNAVVGGDAGLDAFHSEVSGWNDPPNHICPPG